MTFIILVLWFLGGFLLTTLCVTDSSLEHTAPWRRNMLLTAAWFFWPLLTMLLVIALSWKSVEEWANNGD